jgi:predicted  nucleic acid-binding Zn-ribbon protein
LTDKSPSGALERLFRLQELLLEARTKAERRNRTPEHLVHVEAAWQDFRRKRQEVASRRERAEARKKELDEQVAGYADQLKKSEAKRKAVKGQHEYTALLTEVDHAQREIRTREDELLQIEETLAQARADEEALAATSGEEEAGYESQMSEWRAEQAKLTGEVDAAEKAAAGIRSTIDKRLIATFDRIAKMRAGVAVARVAMVANQTAACSSCNVRLRPQLLSDLRLSREILQCESCKRILYWDGSGLP